MCSRGIRPGKQAVLRHRHSVPIIAGLSMEVARADGMVYPGTADTSAVRATCIIEPEGKLRAMVYHPASNGRSIDEFLRRVRAMQTSGANKVANPEAWQSGDKIIVPPPASVEGRCTCRKW